ncbi:alpha/beta fold hydrolase [Chitinophaga ginsengisoli]|uniref:Pimeloyl-ACP methyl ester carboxylesterase n=1 Tax=Chitinophaga ginsengisoli TaxID=363837 RepID=A0A2P8GM41_9BACT|nr:alpha/beta fold hydrolase [Chitinophaga ginsengisoli]PSL35038.1 pimeloyl-ACP methyl ester carboxylesterase [Chitinophaga ginsengisoli]
MKPSLLILHGAIGASRQLRAIAAQLSAQYEVHLFDFPGHGGKELPEAPFSIKLFAEAALEYIQVHHLQQLTIFGYSMGGYVAMYLAKYHPQQIARIITLGTKFHWDEVTAAREIKMLDTAAITAKVPDFAAILADMHAPNDWKEVLQRTADMLTEMGKDNPLKPDDYKDIKTASLIMLGDRDKMVTLEETIATYKALPDAKMAVLPGTPHPVDKVTPSLLAFFLS